MLKPRTHEAHETAQSRAARQTQHNIRNKYNAYAGLVTQYHHYLFSRGGLPLHTQRARKLIKKNDKLIDKLMHKLLLFVLGN